MKWSWLSAQYVLYLKERDMIEVCGVEFRSFNNLCKCLGVRTPKSIGYLEKRHGSLEAWLCHKYNTNGQKMAQILEYAKFNYENEDLLRNGLGKNDIVSRTIIVRALRKFIADPEEAEAVAKLFGRSAGSVDDLVEDLIRRLSSGLS